MILTKEEVDTIFEEAEEAEKPHQQDYVVALYRAVFPDWDNITSVGGYPRYGQKLAFYILGKVRDFDKKYHPDVFAGGCWGLNYGFRLEESLKDWEVTDAHCVVERG